MIKNIVFDFDGTLANSMSVLLEIANNNSEKFGYEKLNEKKIKYLMGKGAKYLIKSLTIPKYRIPLLMREFRSKMESGFENTSMFKGIDKVLIELHKNNYTLGVLTSNSQKNVEKFLKKNNLDIFNFIYHGSSLFGKDKMLKKMLREQKLDKNETIYIGDEDRDIEAAKRVGVKSAAVTWGFNSKKLLKTKNPNYLLDTPGDLLFICNSQFG